MPVTHYCVRHTNETHIVYTRVETGSGHPGHPGQPGHVFAGSSGSDPLYKISGSDPDWITCDIEWRLEVKAATHSHTPRKFIYIKFKYCFSVITRWELGYN